MTAATVRQPELVLAKEIITLVNQADFRGALARAERASLKYPEFRIPAPEGQPSPTFAKTAEWLRTKLPAKPAEPVTPAESQTAKPAPRKAAARKAAPVAKPAPVAEPDPVKIETTVLRLVHNGTDPTSIYGTVQGSPGQLAIGSKKHDGLGWRWSPTYGCFYIPYSGRYAPDYRAINLAISRLESLTQDGQQLYRVESSITTEVEGRTLPVKMSKAEAAQWQRAYDGSRNSLRWTLDIATGVCGGCGAKGLDEKTGRLGKNVDGMPSVECYTCGGFAAPEPKAVVVVETPLDLSGWLALTATAEPMPESAECPSCRQMVPVTDGKLRLHTPLYRSEACRGKLGVAVAPDVEPEPAVKAAPRKSARKAAPAVVLPEPVAVPETDDVQDASLVKFSLQSGLSGSARKLIATEVRQALSRKITYGRAFRGVKIETFNDKVNHRLVLVVAEGGDGFDKAELIEAVAGVVKSVRGVGNRSHK